MGLPLRAAREAEVVQCSAPESVDPKVIALPDCLMHGTARPYPNWT